MLQTLRQRNFCLLWFAGLISFIGNWTLIIALPVFIYELTESALAVSLMLICSTIPSITMSSIAGVFVDRWERRRTMVITNLLLGLVLLILMLVRSSEHLILIYIVVFLKSVIGQFFGPAENAMLPLLVGEEHLVAANALNALNNNLARLIGPAVGGLVMSVAGLQGVVLFDVITYLLAAFLIMLITVTSHPQRDQTLSLPASGWLSNLRHEWVEGMHLAKDSSMLRLLFVVSAITAIGEGIFGVLLVPFVSNILKGEALQMGWLMSAQAVGGILGGVVIARISGKVISLRALALYCTVFGIIDLVIFNYSRWFPGIEIALALFIIVGVPAVGVGAGFNALLQSGVEDRYRGRIFGTLEMVISLFSLLGMIAAGTLSDHLGIVTVINVQGCGYIVAGALFLIAFWQQIKPAASTPERVY
jgi:MFS family permease